MSHGKIHLPPLHMSRYHHILKTIMWVDQCLLWHLTTLHFFNYIYNHIHSNPFSMNHTLVLQVVMFIAILWALRTLSFSLHQNWKAWRPFWSNHSSPPKCYDLIITLKDSSWCHMPMVIVSLYLLVQVRFCLKTI